MLLPFNKFDNILGIDWLNEHDAIVNCRHKQIALKCQNSESICVEASGTNCTTNLIPALLAQKLMRKGCEAYLVYIFDSQIY